MGHRHSSAEFGGTRGIHRADGRPAAPVASIREDVAPRSERSPGAPRRRSLGVRAALLLLRFYQVALSPLMFSSCRFYPSCSRYTYEAVEVHGAARGIWLGVKRLLRCHPFARGGFDPVPASQDQPRALTPLPGARP